MKSVKSRMALMVAIGVVAAAAGIQGLKAQQAPSAKRSVLLKQDTTIPGREAVMALVELPAGSREGRHTHAAELYGFVQEGTVTLEVEAVVPLTELGVATRPLETSAHHWAQTTCAAHPVGYKGMIVAAKVLAASTLDLLSDPSAVQAAKDDFQKETKGKPYVSPLAADAKPKPF